MTRPLVAPSAALQAVTRATPGAPQVRPVESDTGERLSVDGRQAQRAGAIAAQRAEAMLEAFEEAESREADSLLSDLDRASLERFRGLKGAQARQGWEDFRAELARSREVLASRMQSPAARSQFAGLASARQDLVLRTAEVHLTEQVRVYGEEMHTARRRALTRDAIDALVNSPSRPRAELVYGPSAAPSEGAQAEVQGPPAPSSFELFARGVVDEAREVARLKGLDPQGTVDAALDELHEGVVSALLAQRRDLDAADYLANAEMVDRERHRILSDRISAIRDDRLAEEIAVSLYGQPLGSALGAIDRVEGAAPEVKQKAAQAVVSRARDIAAERSRVREEVWTRVTEELAGRRYPILREETAAAVQASGLDDRLNAWLAQGKQFVTDTAGIRALTAEDPAALRRKYPTKDALVGAYREHMSNEDLETLSLRWEAGDAKLPTRDRDFLLSEKLRELTGADPEEELDPELFKRWRDRVTYHERALTNEATTGATKEGVFAAAVDRASKEGVYLDRRKTDYRLGVSLAPGDLNRAFVEVDDPTTGRKQMVEVRLDLPMPGTSVTYLEFVRRDLQEQALRTEEGKPLGFVRVARGVVPYESVSVADTATLAHILRAEDNPPPTVETVGQRAMVDIVVAEAVQQALFAESVRREFPNMQTVRQRALAELQRREAELTALGLSMADIRAALFR